MAVHYRTQGFVIKETDRGEANQLFTIYTEDFGKLEILGKAVRKIKSKLRGGAQLFYLSETEFIQGKTHKTLTDTILINNFKNLRKDLKKLAIAYQITGALDSLVKGQEPDKELWDLLNETFKRLNNENSEIIYYYFLWNLFSILGYQPELYHCSVCQKKIVAGNFYFGLKEGGIVCQKCFKKPEENKEVNEDVIKILRLFLARDWPILTKLKISADSQELLKHVSEGYLNEILGKN
ncbi:DNA repair protein RecO [subsurface metagenome]